LITDGTSASAPLAAGIFTRLGLTTAMSNDLSWIYANRSAFHDIGSGAYPLPPEATGTNAAAGSSCGILCTAGPGWDGPSGVGSPNGANLAAVALIDASPQPYPDAGICGPYGPCGTNQDTGGTKTGSAGCSCDVGARGRSSAATWAGVLLSLAAVGGCRCRTRRKRGTAR
jgi:hypothetical protein